MRGEKPLCSINLGMLHAMNLDAINNACSVHRKIINNLISNGLQIKNIKNIDALIFQVGTYIF